MSSHYSGKAVMLMAKIKRVLAQHGVYISLADNANVSSIERQCLQVDDAEVHSLLDELKRELGFTLESLA